jgi:hypothetical protein
MSAVKASADSPMRIGRLHAEADANLEASGLPYTILRPHFFMQNVMMGAQSVAGEGKLYMSFGQGELGMVDVRDIASSAASILTADGDKFVGNTYTPTGPESISLGAVAGALSSALGKPVDYVDVPIEGSREAMMGMGFPEWVVEGFLEYFQSYSTGWGGLCERRCHHDHRQAGALHSPVRRGLRGGLPGRLGHHPEETRARRTGGNKRPAAAVGCALGASNRPGPRRG